MTLPSVQALTRAVAALFDSAVGLTFYRSIVDPPPPVDANGVVMAYAVLHPQPGDATTGSLTHQPGQLVWGFHLTAAGGDDNYCGFAVDQIRARVDGRTLTVSGVKVGLMQPPFGAIPPPMRPDLNVAPPRLFVPLEYRVMAVPTNPT